MSSSCPQYQTRRRTSTEIQHIKVANAIRVANASQRSHSLGANAILNGANAIQNVYQRTETQHLGFGSLKPRKRAAQIC